MPELPVGQQEQELRQLLNKDKSKRSKMEPPSHPTPGWPVSMARLCGPVRAGVGVTPAQISLCFLRSACECRWGRVLGEG